MPKTKIPILAILLLLTTLLTACTIRPAPEPLPPAETPTSTPDTPTALPSATSTPLSPDAQALKDIVFSSCIPVEQSLPDDIEISWNLLAMQGGSVFIYDPEDGTKVEIPHLTEITPEYYYKFLEGFYISPDGKWLAYSDRSYKKLFIEPVETLLTNTDTDRLFWEMDHWFEMGAFHLSYKVVKRLKVIGYAWDVCLMQMPGQQAEN